ncbi:MAG: DNA mismatch repair endonuclease MutL, partial [Chitinophagales bacterium]|nr:DNA mismatch repair endonuclease MutL [Chitinophagales bacterium]
DLFNIRTMGFRGEALASIAAVAQVDLKTKLHDEAVGTWVQIEGSKILKHEACQAASGTSITVKNLFYNTPARRNFLKSDNVELKNIIEEFTRIALAHPQIAMRISVNGNDLYHLKSGNLKQRIVQLFGDAYNEKIVPVEERSYAISVYGFISKPNAARKTRGEQYFFVNKRFIKSAYLHNAVMKAYENLIPKDHFPFYVLFLEIDPTRIDVNVHPQKYEIKFDDEKLVYTFVHAGAKHSLGAYGIAPTIDFNQEQPLQQFGAFDSNRFTGSHFITQIPETMREAKKIAPPEEFSSFQAYRKRKPENWAILQPQLQNINDANADAPQQISTDDDRPVIENSHTSGRELILRSSSAGSSAESTQPYQIHRKYILSPIKTGMVFIDQQAAHERILFERYLRLLQNNRSVGQRQLFPQTMSFNPSDAALLREILPEICNLGFEIEEFGDNTFIIHALPADLGYGNEKDIIEELLEQFKNSMHLQKLSKREKMAQALAASSCIKHGKALSTEEMKLLIDELFACENPYYTPSGKKTLISISLDEMQKKFDARK